MKKVIFIVILVACFQQLKAQQIVKPLPDMKLSDGLNNAFKPKVDSPLALYTKLTMADPSLKDIPAILNPDEMVIYSKMPIAKLPASNDRMPILNPANNGMHYDLLIKKVVVNPVETVVKPVP